jgi:hypothetical protein
MGFNTKRNLSNNRYIQNIDDILNLSGTTNICGTLNINNVSGSTSGGIDINSNGQIYRTSVYLDNKNPTGFVNGSNIDISYNYSNRTVTLTGDLSYYWRGIKKSLNSPWTSSGHTATIGNWYLYSSNGNDIIWSQSPWNFYDIQIAALYYSGATASRTFAIRETHELMDYTSHEDFHTNVGTYLKSGGQAYSYTANTATDYAVSPSFGVAVIKDEDLSTTIPYLDKVNGYTLMHVSGNSSVYTYSAARPFSAPGTNQFIYVNTPTTGAMTVGVNNRYYNVYQLLIPTTSDVNSQRYRMVFIQPQATYTTLATAQAEDTRGLYLGDLSNRSAEFVLYARITYFTANGNTNYGKVTIPTNGITYITGSKMSTISLVGVSSNNHANLTNLNWSDSGHIGTNNSLAGFNSSGIAENICLNNGLSKVGSSVVLGGALTGNTSLTGNYSLNICSGAKLNTTCGYQISGVTFFDAGRNSLSNVRIGQNALINNSTGVNNIAIGLNSLYSNLTGLNNIAIGCSALSANTCNNNIAIGYRSLSKNICGFANISLGTSTMNNNISGRSNVAIGYNTMLNNISGCYNVANGVTTLYRNISGSYNLAYGYCALYCNTSGNTNIGIGNNSGYLNLTGSSNIAIGDKALYRNLVSNNIAIGNCSLSGNTTGRSNIGFGNGALFNNVNGISNIGIGTSVLFCNKYGNNSVAIGMFAGCASTGSTNIFLGSNAGLSETGSGKLYIGTGSTSLIMGDMTTPNECIILPYLKLRCTPSVGSLSDNILTWNSTDCTVKAIAGSTVLNSAITGATNGLSKVGQNVVLGGTLTGNTNIGLNTKNITISGGTNIGILYTPACVKIGTLSDYSSYIEQYAGTTDITQKSSPTRFTQLYITPAEACMNSVCSNNICYNNFIWTCASGVEITADNSIGNKTQLNVGSSTLMICGSAVDFSGIQYCGDYSTNYTDRSLVDKGFVMTLVGGSGITGATNGLNINNNNVVLGGILTNNTNICVDNNCFSVNNWTDATNNVEMCITRNILALTQSSAINALQSSVIVQQSCLNLFHQNVSGNGSDIEKITLDSTGTKICSRSGITISSGNANFKGVQYAANYCASYTDRSLVDKGFVMSLVGGGIACGQCSVVMAGGIACGIYSISMGCCNTVISNNSVIIGGVSNTLCSGNTCSVMLGGNSIVIPSNCYTESVIVPKLVVHCTGTSGGIIMYSPNGTKYRLTVADGGTLSITAI